MINVSSGKLPLAGLIAAICIALAGCYAGSIFAGYTFPVQKVMQVLSGNFLFDALFEFAITGLVVIPVVLLTSFYRLKRVATTSFVKTTIILFASIYTALSAIYILSQLITPLLPILYDQPFKYIRASIGVAFLASIFSIPGYYSVQNNTLKYLLIIGMVLPILIVPLIPWSLELNGMSWSHLDD